MRKTGEIALLKLILLTRVKGFKILSRDENREIPARVIFLESKTLTGVFNYFYLGGWVLSDEVS